ncbi:MAG: alcohol dehydrogenase catalytic domain-containing protein [Burkholderiales bacterium]
MVLKSKGAPFTLETVPDPVPGAGEAVAKVLACGAGLTVHHTRAGRSPVRYPRIVGHEITGEVVAVGAGVTQLKTGDAVTAYYYLTCGDCYWCRINRETLCDNLRGHVGRDCDGGYAEYIKLPARSFIKLPAGLDWRKHPAEVGVICDAIATPVKLIRRARVSYNDTVAVFGAGGGLGVHMLMLARWAHARSVVAVDVMASKFDACLKAGAHATVDASKGKVDEQLRELTEGRGVDVAIDFVCSADTTEAAIRSLNKGGRLMLLAGQGKGFHADRTIQRNELEVMGSRYATRQEVIESLELVARGDVWPMVNIRVPLAEAEAVHQQLDKGLVTGRAALVMS